jgi:hypothetical protein
MHSILRLCYHTRELSKPDLYFSFLVFVLTIGFLARLLDRLQLVAGLLELLARDSKLTRESCDLLTNIGVLELSQSLCERVDASMLIRVSVLLAGSDSFLLVCGARLYGSKTLCQGAMLTVKLERPEEVGARFCCYFHLM